MILPQPPGNGFKIKTHKHGKLSSGSVVAGFSQGTYYFLVQIVECFAGCDNFIVLADPIVPIVG